MLELCWTLWSTAEEHLRAKELEEQSLYRFKSKTHIIQDSEEEVCARQLKDMFPSYEEFVEEEDESSESVENMDEDDGGGREEGSETYVVGAGALVKFSAEDLQRVANLHLLMYREKVELSSSRAPNSKTMLYELSNYLTTSLGSIPGTY